jgi:hypothetical protein
VQIRPASLLLPLVLAACGDAVLPTGPTRGLDAAVAAARAAVLGENATIPIAVTVEIPCAAGGAGEVVTLSGRLHVRVHATIDARGGLHIRSHTNPQGVTGRGLTTGTVYRGTGATLEQARIGRTDTFTYANNFRIIGAGAGSDVVLHQNLHVTVNANRAITADADNFRIECR